MASPDGSTAGVPGACSQAHQSLLALPPSTWWAAVEDPKRNPSGNSGSGDAGPLALAEAGRGAQRLGLVRALPREVVVLAAEVTVGRGLLVDGAVQLEVVAEGARAQVEVLAHELRDLRAAELLRPERLDDVLPQVLRDQRLRALAVLRRDQQLLDLHRAAVEVADGHLGLAVGAQVGHDLGLAHV